MSDKTSRSKARKAVNDAAWKGLITRDEQYVLYPKGEYTMDDLIRWADDQQANNIFTYVIVQNADLEDIGITVFL